MTPPKILGYKGSGDCAIPRCHLQVVLFTPADQESTTERITTASDINWAIDQCGNKPTRLIRSTIHEHSVSSQLQADNSRSPLCQGSSRCFWPIPAT